MKTFDAIVIGAGTGGQTAAIELAASGWNVAIVEMSATPGGVCALHGCQAKKYFAEAAALAAASKHLKGLGVTAPPAFSWTDIAASKNSFTSQIPENTKKSLRGNNVEYIEGNAAFRDRSGITVNGETLGADYFVIATGSRPMDLPIEGHEHLATSNDFLALEALPERIVFVGGGFISFEFAHFAARLGGSAGNIHILEVMDRPLGPFDADMVSQLAAASAFDGIDIQCGVTISSIEKASGGFAVHLESGETIETDLVVNGAGRAPALAGLDLERAGIDATRRGIQVDSGMLTSAPQIYAVGDCVDSLQLARVADREAQVAAENIVAEKSGETGAEISYREIPAVLFTYPQLAMVGKTEQALRKEEVKYWRAFETELGWPTYRRIGLRHAAFKILVDADDRILGAHILSDNATGIINVFRQAMLDSKSIRQVRDDAILSPYPSRESDILYMLNPLLG